MKKKIVCSTLFLALACLLTGCVIRPARAVVVEPLPPPPPLPVAELVVEQAPPAPRVEVIPAPPSPNHVWIGGVWSWRDGRHVWLAGHYVVRPHPHAVWVAARWEHRPHGWVWVEGSWR